MGLKLALIDLGLNNSAVQVGPDKIDLVGPDGAAAVSIPLQEHQLLEINWFTSWSGPGSDPHTSLADVMLYLKDLSSENEKERAEAKEFFNRVFRDAIVLIGPTDPLLQDLAPTPFDETPVPKVSVYANVLKTIRAGTLSAPSAREWPMSRLTFLLTLAVAGPGRRRGGAKGIRYKIFCGGGAEHLRGARRLKCSATITCCCRWPRPWAPPSRPVSRSWAGSSSLRKSRRAASRACSAPTSRPHS